MVTTPCSHLSRFTVRATCRRTVAARERVVLPVAVLLGHPAGAAGGLGLVAGANGDLRVLSSSAAHEQATDRSKRPCATIDE